MKKKFCPKCKTTTAGFAYCPKCGGTTEILKEEIREITKSDNGNQAALWCHLAPLILFVVSALTSFILIGFVIALLLWVPPLIIKTQNADNEFVVRHAKSSFNFQIFWLIASFGIVAIYLFIGILTLGIGLIVGAIAFLLLIVPLLVFLVVVMIKASMAASAGNEYEYPLVLFKVMK